MKLRSSRRHTGERGPVAVGVAVGRRRTLLRGRLLFGPDSNERFGVLHEALCSVQ
jgi:hypothetical protein